MFNVIFYKTANNIEPVRDYINELNKKSKTDKGSRIKLNKIFSYMRLLQERGTKMGEPFIKRINDELWELRPINDRIFFFYWKDNTFVLLHCFAKKTKKTPTKEINKANGYLKDWLNRNN